MNVFRSLGPLLLPPTEPDPPPVNDADRKEYRASDQEAPKLAGKANVEMCCPASKCRNHNRDPENA